jgi:hypothetical protein
MVPKYSSFRITEGIEKFYDFFKTYSVRGSYLPGGWAIRLDEWYDPNVPGSTINYVVFRGEYNEITFDVHFAFKPNFREAFVGNVCPTNRSQLSPNDYNQCLDKFVNEVVKWYDKNTAWGEFRYEYTALPSTPIKPLVLEASKVPAGHMTFSFTDDSGVCVDMSAVIKADIRVSGLVEHYEPKDPDAVFTSAKVYSSAVITLDIGKTDAYKIVGSEMSPIERLKKPNDINGFEFNGSTYVATSERVTGLCSVKVLADRMVITLI